MRVEIITQQSNYNALKIDGGRRTVIQTERQKDRKTNKVSYRGAALLKDPSLSPDDWGLGMRRDIQIFFLGNSLFL